MINFCLIFVGILSIFYDFVLIFLNPGTFLDNLTTFTHIWTVLGAYLIFVGIYRKKAGHSFWSIWKKWVKIVFISLMSTGFVISIICLCFIFTPKIVPSSQSCDYVILLGGGIDKDGNLPKPVQWRVDKAYECLTYNKDAVCVVTGGTLKWLPYPEAPEIKRQLVERGISSQRILVEDQALDTIQNLQFSCDLLQKTFGKSKEEILNSNIVIVTSRFHLRRAERLAKRMGFENVNGIAAKCPSVNVLHNYVREICAYLKLNIRIFLTGKPEHI